MADGGDDHGEAGTPGLDAGITHYGARPIPAAHAKLGRFSKEEVRADQATETDPCPARARLTVRFDAGEHGRPSRSYATSAGGSWALKPQGTRRTGGRRMTRWVDAHLLAAMAQRVRGRPAVMKQRPQGVEHPCGTMQRWWEAGYGRRRGLEKVRTEFRVPVLAYNLRRVVTLVEMPRLLAALG